MDKILAYEKDPDEDFYGLLRCSELSSTEQIITEYKAIAKELHPDKNLNNPDSNAHFAKIQRAKDVLTNEETRKQYDTWRNSGMAMSYDQWCAMRDSVHTSMHWVTVKKQPMLKESKSDHEDSKPSQSSSGHKPAQASTLLPMQAAPRPCPWERDPASETLRKFRNYEI